MARFIASGKILVNGLPRSSKIEAVLKFKEEYGSMPSSIQDLETKEEWGIVGFCPICNEIILDEDATISCEDETFHLACACEHGISPSGNFQPLF